MNKRELVYIQCYGVVEAILRKPPLVTDYDKIGYKVSNDLHSDLRNPIQRLVYYVLHGNIRNQIYGRQNVRSNWSNAYANGSRN